MLCRIETVVHNLPKIYLGQITERLLLSTKLCTFLALESSAKFKVGAEFWHIPRSALVMYVSLSPRDLPYWTPIFNALARK